MTAYANDSDLIQVRSKILTYLETSGISSEEFHNQAKTYIDRDIENGWYRKVALSMGFDYKEYPFDISLILDYSQFKDLGIYKALFLIYRYLAKDTVENDAFAIQRDYYEKQYNLELNRLIESGITYDWDNSGLIDDNEKFVTAQTGLVKSVVTW